jgi:hypothetical protein
MGRVNGRWKVDGKEGEWEREGEVNIALFLTPHSLSLLPN